MNRATPEQQAAIAATGNVLVMAGAGTGKTYTLVERCLAHLLHPTRPVPLDRILMVTFTEAAAAEMRQRLRSALQAHLASHPDHPGLAEQLALVDTAQISTLHGFCLHLVRDHFHQLGLDPDFTVLSPDQNRLVITEVLDALLQRHYTAPDPTTNTVQQLVLDFGRGREQPVRQTILRLHHYTQTLASPQAWFSRELERLQQSEPAHWREWLELGFASWRDLWLPELEQFADTNPKAGQALSILRESPGLPSRPALATALGKLVALDADWPRGMKTRFREPLAPFLEDAAFLFALVDPASPTDPLVQDWNWIRPSMVALLELTCEFNGDYTAIKRTHATLDFHDLEQLALDLLWDRARQQATPLAHHWRSQFDLVFVDEYQDINEAQDTLLTALGRAGPGANRFLVGDVKQSIYRFRLADPRIFQRYATDWSQPGRPGRVLPLTTNFRSHPAILEFVNALFSQLMHPAVGGIRYSPDQWLRPGPTTPQTPGPTAPPAVEVHLLPRAHPRSHPDDDLSTAEHEAHFVAQQVLQVVAGGVRWSDVAILLRSPRTRAETYARVFAAHRVPLHIPQGGFYDRLEITDLLSLLTLLDNPLQDLPLLAVLRSPLVGMSPDELAAVRLSNQGALWPALRRLHRRSGVPRAQRTAVPNPSLEAFAQSAHAKAGRFLEAFQRWRHLAQTGALSECLETILEDSGYETWVAAQPTAPEALANIRRLLGLTRQFDQLQRQGLQRFLRFVEAQRDVEADPGPTASQAPDAVQFLSIHQSKGLEFPIVIVADLARRFNFDDLRGPVILDELHGLCPMVQPSGHGQRYPSLPAWLARERQHRETLGEELRLFYVACTRPRQRLILCGSPSEKALQEHWPETKLPFTTRQLLCASCWLDWLGPCLTQLAPSRTATDGATANEFQWHVHSHSQFTTADRSENCPPAGRCVPAVVSDLSQPASLNALLDQLAWTYPHTPATREPAKVSVSQLRRRARDEADNDARPIFVAPLRPARHDPASLDPAARGTVHHRLLELLPLDPPVTQGSLLATVELLRAHDALDPEEIAALDLEAVLAFWRSELGRRIQQHAPRVQRELPFTARFTPGDLRRLGITTADSLDPAERIIVQGIADLVVVHPAELWLIDFKTDRLALSDLPSRARDYVPQLGAYALALERIYRRPVAELWLHFLHLQHSFALRELCGAPQ
jgi:ATP-dependent helicase/nuclease subunit A